MKAHPPAGSASSSSALARAMFSREPRSSIWLVPTLTMMPHSGRTYPHSCLIWPMPRMPISTTTAPSSAEADRTVLGTPSSLFWLPEVAVTEKPADSTSRTRFFVVVLPLEPVRPMTRPPSLPRQKRARSTSARWVSETFTMAAPASRAASAASGLGSCATRAHTAPERMAAATNAWPSTRSPGRAA